MWKKLALTERDYFQKLAAKDKLRYDNEKASFLRYRQDQDAANDTTTYTETSAGGDIVYKIKPRFEP